MVQFSSPTVAARRVGVTLAAAICVVLASAVHAQHDQGLSASSATKPAPLTYNSVLSRYKPMTDQKLGAWRAANDRVGQIGGWRTYLKEVQQPEVTTPVPAAASDVQQKPATPSVPTAPTPHAGHGAKP